MYLPSDTHSIPEFLYYLCLDDFLQFAQCKSVYYQILMILFPFYLILVKAPQDVEVLCATCRLAGSLI